MATLPDLMPSGRFLTDAGGQKWIECYAADGRVEAQKAWLATASLLAQVLTRIRNAISADILDRGFALALLNPLLTAAKSVPPGREAWHARGQNIFADGNRLIATVCIPVTPNTIAVLAAAPQLVAAADTVRFGLTRDAEANAGRVDVLGIRMTIDRVLDRL